jgi:hypothetical protein
MVAEEFIKGLRRTRFTRQLGRTFLSLRRSGSEVEEGEGAGSWSSLDPGGQSEHIRLR